jgi:phosphate transport system protein
MVEHRQHFDRELEAIEAKLIELFGMICEDLPGVTEALLNGNNATARQLADHERVTDALYQEIEQLVCRAILLWAPVASDLRFLISAMRIAPELERSHDLVCHIAARADDIAGADLSPRCRELIERMSELACEMWQRTMDCWRQRDRLAVTALTDVDREVDELHANLVAELASGRMPPPVTMRLTLVARFYERLGDHAANVARRVVYLAGSAAA